MFVGSGAVAAAQTPARTPDPAGQASVSAAGPSAPAQQASRPASPHPRSRRPTRSSTCSSASRSRATTSSTRTARTIGSTSCARTTRGRTCSAFSKPPSSSRARRPSTRGGASARGSICSSARRPKRAQGSPANEPRPDAYRNVWQAYGTYVFDVGRGLTADFGKFASMLGYETNYAKDNNQFSRAYLFNFLPFYHSGARLSLPAGDKVTLMYMLTNGIQQTEDFNNFKSNHIAAIVKPNGSLSLDDQLLLRSGAVGWRPARWPGRVLQGLRHLCVLHRDVEAQLRRGRQLRDQRGQQERSVAVAAGHWALRAVSGFRSRRRCRCATSGWTTRASSAASRRCSRSSRSRASTSSPTASSCAANSAATGRTSCSSRAASPAICAKGQNTFLVGLVWWFGNKQGAW